MSWMCAGCSLFELDVSGFDTSQVTTIDGMFYECHCPMIDVSNFDTSNAKTLKEMFYGCQVVRLDCSSLFFRKADSKQIFHKACVQTLLFSSQNQLSCFHDESFVCHSFIYND